MPRVASAYTRRRPPDTVFHRLDREHLATFLEHAETTYAAPLPRYVVNAFERYLACGDFSKGFVRSCCDACRHDVLVAFHENFGSSLNAHAHWHDVAVDGVFEKVGEGVRFHEAPAAPPTTDAGPRLAGASAFAFLMRLDLHRQGVGEREVGGEVSACRGTAPPPNPGVCRARSSRGIRGAAGGLTTLENSLYTAVVSAPGLRR